MALRELTLLSFFLVASSLFAETAADYVNRGAQKYIFGQDQAAASEVATGLTKFPNDPELQGIAGLLRKKKPPPQNQQEQNQQKQQQQQQYYPSPDPQRLPQTRISSNTTARNQDPTYLQPHQGSSTAIVEPPSPLQQPVPDHQISSQPGSQEPSPTDSQTGVSTGTTMPAGQPRGASMRQLDKALPPPARESSLLGQRDAQAAPGVQAFNSNVVPIGSRGQPYREGAQEADDRGRDSPTREMTQDEVENYMRLMKEHKELSKYIACYCYVESYLQTNQRRNIPK